MTILEHTDLQRIVAAFAIEGELAAAAPYGNGHINDTYCATVGGRRYILQRLNDRVFRDPAGLMDNVARCCAHLQAKLAGQPDAERRALRLVPTRDGEQALLDDDDRWWRCYPFIEGSCTREQVETPEEAEAAALAFGAFIRDLADLPGEPLNETIPAFHHTPRRLDQLQAAIDADACGRAIECRSEIHFVFARSEFASLVQDGIERGELPLRVSHNDTKINNVLLDQTSGRGLCVIDLDTLMPGSPLFDISDVLRTSISTCPEDEPDPTRIDLRMDVLAAVYRGFIAELGDELNPAERTLLPHCASLLAYECGVRFLADHIAGDRYFKVHRPGHNLDRARSQFAIVHRCEERADAIAAICAELCS